MFVNQFERFNHLIRNELQEKAQTLPYPTEEYFEKIIAILSKDASDITNKINSIKIIHPNQKKAEWRMKGYQDEIIDLMDHVLYLIEEIGFTAEDNAPLSNSWHELYMKIMKLLSDLLNFMESRHPDLYINDRAMPSFLEKTKRAECCEKLAILIASVQEGSDSFLVLKYLEDPLKNDDQFFTFVQYNYFDKIFREMREIIQEGQPDDLLVINLQTYLCIMDYNEDKFIDNCIQQFQQQIPPGNSKTIIKKLLQFRRTVSSIKNRKGLSLYEDCPSVKAQLLEFLTNEISIHIALIETEAIISPGEWKGFKINTSLSQQEMASILRILMEKGVLRDIDKEDLLQFIVAFFKTEDGKDASFDGLCKYFDQNGEKTLKMLKGFF